MTKDLVIGIDCSTTATKAIVWDKKGNPVAEGRKDMQILNPKPDWVEQKAEEWWSATQHALREVTAQVDCRRIAAICITHQRETFVPLDRNMNPLRNGILWVDTRAAEQVEKLKKIGAEKIHQITGLYPNLYAANCKIMWMRENEPSLFEKVYKFVDVHAYLVFKLTGNLVTTYSCAWATGLVDILKFKWSREILQMIGVEEEKFCPLAAPGDVLGTLRPEVARLLGLPEGIPVAGGGGDGQCAALGAGVVEEGVASLNLGTAVVSQLYSPDYVIGKSFRTECGCVPRTYIAESVIGGGTFTVSWFVNQFGQREKEIARINGISAEEIFEIMASKVKKGTPRLLLVPYWKATMGPYWDPLARGIVIGWCAETGKAHLYRAILEGIAFEQKFLYEDMEDSFKRKIEKIILLGGGARSSLWRQIVADVTGTAVFTPHTFEATSLGAAMLAAYAAGIYPGIPEASQAMSRLHQEQLPDPQMKEYYLKIYQKVYKHLFPAIKELVDEFTKINLST